MQGELENWEIDTEDSNVIVMYEEMLDCEGPVSVCGMKFDASRILKKLDPIAYRCGMNDFVDGLDKSDFGEYRELEEKLEELEYELEYVVNS